jgi:hypothetical protein
VNSPGKKEKDGKLNDEHDLINKGKEQWNEQLKKGLGWEKLVLRNH